MQFIQATIQERKQLLKDTYIIRLKPIEYTFTFLPGQYVFLKNPAYLPDEAHPFSIASSPLEKNYLEFCIKVYGDWTERLSTLKKGSLLYLSHPLGNFIWKNNIEHVVFLLGGIGISPIISMLRYLSQQHDVPKTITILYGNRTPETIVYRDELEQLTEILPIKLVHIFSHIADSHPWEGYRGFITEEIIENETHLQEKPTFFVIGPPIFTEKVKKILLHLHTSPDYIKEELLETLPLHSLI